MSVDVSKVTPGAPGVTPPNVIPSIVTVKAVVGMAAPPVVMTKNVSVVELQVAFIAGTLLDPTATIGITDSAKK